jgi:hypothetical protein
VISKKVLQYLKVIKFFENHNNINYYNIKNKRLDVIDMNTITKNMIKILNMQYDINMNDINTTNPNGAINKIMINELNELNELILNTINELHDIPINDENMLTNDEIYAMNENMNETIYDINELINDINDNDMLITNEYKNKLINEYNDNDELTTIYTENLCENDINLYEKNIMKKQLYNNIKLINDMKNMINK